jgi:hypothetical protein
MSIIHQCQSLARYRHERNRRLFIDRTPCRIAHNLRGPTHDCEFFSHRLKSSRLQIRDIDRDMSARPSTTSVNELWRVKHWTAQASILLG